MTNCAKNSIECVLKSKTANEQQQQHGLAEHCFLLAFVFSFVRSVPSRFDFTLHFFRF